MKLTKSVANSYNKLKALADKDSIYSGTMKEISGIIFFVNPRQHLFILRELGLIDFTDPIRGEKRPTNIKFFGKDVEEYIGKTIPHKKATPNASSINRVTLRLIHLFECLKELDRFSNEDIHLTMQAEGSSLAMGSIGPMLERLENMNAIKITYPNGRCNKHIEILKDKITK